MVVVIPIGKRRVINENKMDVMAHVGIGGGWMSFIGMVQRVHVFVLNFIVKLLLVIFR
jgi:hypothetical protein